MQCCHGRLSIFLSRHILIILLNTSISGSEYVFEISLYFHNDIFLKYELDKLRFIDNLLDIKDLRLDSKFESFVVSVADRNRVGIKEKSAKTIIESIEKSKEIPFEKVLFALGVKDVGEVGAKNLASHFKNINTFFIK